MHTLLFIYNAKSGRKNSLFDIGHKLFSPKTYICNLCNLTHKIFSENKTWKIFKTESNIDMNFYHIDEFLKLFPDTNYAFPIILNKTSGELNTFLASAEINKISTVEELIFLIKRELR